MIWPPLARLLTAAVAGYEFALGNYLAAALSLAAFLALTIARRASQSVSFFRAGSDPRPFNDGVFNPSHWDGRGFSPYVVWGFVVVFVLVGVVVAVFS